jgi:hypothetical protein
LAAGLVAALVATTGAAFVAPSPAAAVSPVTQVQYLNASTGSDSVVFKEVTVSCPAGQQVIGGGYRLRGASGSVVLDDFIPTSTAVTVSAGEIIDPGQPSGTTADWSITATAVCADPLPGLEIVVQPSEFNRGTAREVSAICPFGKRVIGAGASLANGFGQISTARLEIFDNHTTAAAIDDENGYSGNWSITAYAICVNTFAGVHIVRAASVTGFNSTSPKTAIVGCDASTKPVAAGWALDWGGRPADQVLNAFADISAGGGVVSLGVEDANGFSGSWTNNAIAVCVDNF